MQYVKRWYTPVITTLTFLIVVALAGWFLAQVIGFRMTGAVYDLRVPIDELTPVETAVATGIGAEMVTIALGRGIWIGELDINTEDYDGVKLETTGDGRHSSMWWNGARNVIVIGAANRAQVYPGEVRVRTGAVPGYRWTVTFTRYDAR